MDKERRVVKRDSLSCEEAHLLEAIIDCVCKKVEGKLPLSPKKMLY